MRRLCFRFREEVLFLAAALCASGQVAQKANQDYSTATLREKAAFEMDHWGRPAIERTAALVASLGLRPGDAVADVGAGVGYLLPHLVAAVGDRGSVVAEDIFPDFLAVADEKIRVAGWRNARTVLGTERNPSLPIAQLDVVLLLDTYHHLNYPGEMLRHIRRALKPQGRLIIVEYYRSRKHPGASAEDLRTHIRLDRDEVAAEVSAHGFRLSRQFDHLPHEYVLIFDRIEGMRTLNRATTRGGSSNPAVGR